jgi:hypothetical protein
MSNSWIYVNIDVYLILKFFKDISLEGARPLCAKQRPSSMSAGASETDIRAGNSIPAIFENCLKGVIFLSHSKILLVAC